MSELVQNGARETAVFRGTNHVDLTVVVRIGSSVRAGETLQLLPISIDVDGNARRSTPEDAMRERHGDGRLEHAYTRVDQDRFGSAPDLPPLTVVFDTLREADPVCSRRSLHKRAEQFPAMFYLFTRVGAPA